MPVAVGGGTPARKAPAKGAEPTKTAAKKKAGTKTRKE